MSEIADRFRTVAAAFTATVDAVPPAGWDAPTPCEGWVGRDVVVHLVEWLPAFFLDQWGIARPDAPAPADDPAGALGALRDALQAALDDPEVAGAERDTPMGRKTFADAFDMIGLSDVLIHTWDLARAAGLDDRLDAAEVHRQAAELDQVDPAVDAAMRASGFFGPRIEVGDDADEQTRLLAFFGRRA